MENTTCNCNPKPAPKFPEQVTGMYILAESLRRLGLMDVFGLVGIPVTEAAYAMQKVGMNFYGFRFEQQAGMAAATYGYLTRRPGVLLTVSSLGFMNGLTATANATVNCYPMIQISGATDPTMVDMKMGTYEELDQLNTARPLVKAAFRCSYAKDIPSAVARAYRAAVSGRPGGVYIDMTTPALAEIMDADDAEKLFYTPVDIYSTVAPNAEAVKRAVELLTSAKKPAILLGKGAAYAGLEGLVKELVETYKIPYYPMSMAKGLLPDNGPLSAISCRSTIMEEADVVVVIGARLNWMLSFGRGKWNPAGKFIQLDACAEEIDRNVPIAAPVVGDMRTSLQMILDGLKGKTIAADPTWVSGLQTETAAKNAKFAKRLEEASTAMPMNHWTALSVIKPILEANPDIVLVNDGHGHGFVCRSRRGYRQERRGHRGRLRIRFLRHGLRHHLPFQVACDGRGVQQRRHLQRCGRQSRRRRRTRAHNARHQRPVQPDRGVLRSRRLPRRQRGRPEESTHRGHRL